ncbi:MULTISPECIES: hypothetical protein [Thermomonosporaceae]|uniref:hypothetical protein n=1 Tax=Thermomonosporaceae TaxID=2012 RepID=UPI00255B123D|nr:MULTISPECIES: hypothetical protein [Thermomonosporaceae]MDL4771726.1 hypothetical protein [Actinomadura xylanilytica]
MTVRQARHALLRRALAGAPLTGALLLAPPAAWAETVPDAAGTATPAATARLGHGSGPGTVTPPSRREPLCGPLHSKPASKPAAAPPPPDMAEEGGRVRGALPTVIAVALLVAAFVLHQRLSGTSSSRPHASSRRWPFSSRWRRPERPPLPPDPEPRPRPRPADAAEDRSPSAADVLSDLAHPAGLAVAGPGADGFVRAVLVELLTRESPHTRVVISRRELNRLFGGELDEAVRQSLESRLHVCGLLAEAVEHLELEMLMTEAELANPDLSPTGGHRPPATYWICTPGEDDETILSLVRRGPAHRLVALMLGPWPHGRTCTAGPSGTLAETGGTVPTLPRAEALARLHWHAAVDRDDGF